jgi:hypothetical protein
MRSLDAYDPWFRGRLDEILEDAANLPEPHAVAQEIAEDPQTHLKRSRTFGDLQGRTAVVGPGSRISEKPIQG